MRLKIIAYFSVALFIFTSCTPTPVAINNSEEVNEEVIISEEIWHWCYGNSFFLNRSDIYIDDPYVLQRMDIYKIRYLSSTLGAAEIFWFKESRDPEIYNEENNWGNPANIYSVDFENSIINKDERSLEICRIWFNINNP